MPEHDDVELTDRDREVESRLTELGPLMARVAHSRAELPDAAFISALRAQLVQPQSVTPDPGFQRRLRTRLVGRQAGFPWRVGAAVGAVFAAAVVVLVLLHPWEGPSQQRAVAVGVPPPTTKDLTRGFPQTGLVAGGGGGSLSPVQSLAAYPPHSGYAGRLRLTVNSLPSMPSTLPVYRLADAPFQGASVTRIGRRLGIAAKHICMSDLTGQRAPCTAGTWTVVAQNLPPARGPLHSLAISPVGETVFHDTSYVPSRYRGTALTPARAVVTARRWLTMLGWPGARAPVTRVGPEPGLPPGSPSTPLAVAFGWRHGVQTVLPAAIVWVAPTGQIIEAHLWPPIVHKRIVPARPVEDAWSEVQRGKAPTAIRAIVFLPLPGSGSASSTDVVQVLVTPRHAPAYLEPAYRFSGKVRVQRISGSHPWYALVPAIRTR